MGAGAGAAPPASIDRRTPRVAALAALLLALFAGSPARGEIGPPDPIDVHCRVFLDVDGDGVRDPGEPPLPGMRVTDGVAILHTGEDGTVDLVVDRSIYRFATLTVPAGARPTTPWYRHLPVGSAGPDTVDFALAPWLASATDPIRWVHIADSQVRTWGDPYAIDGDLEQVNECDPAPLFVINTGDLVDVGADSTHWEAYLQQTAVSDAPVFHVVGNHDTVSTATPLEMYERYVGPPYYSFEAGSWHFIVFNSEAAGTATPAQDVWLASDVHASPAGSRHLLFQHRMLGELLPDRATLFAALGIVANFSGHWHCHQFTDRPQGILDFNLCRIRSGPLDRTPRAFGLVMCSADGRIEYDLRRLAVDHRAILTAPGSGSAVGSDVLDVLVQAYDTSSRVTGLVATVSGPGGMSPAVSLAREGVSLWRGAVDLSAAGLGDCEVVVTGAFEDGTPIQLAAPVRTTGAVPIRRNPLTSWPMFRREPKGTSFTTLRLRPPLDVAWATALPGMVALSSPVVAGGRVFLGCRSEIDGSDGGVIACAAATGTPLWFRSIPGGVALAPAVAGDVVLVTALPESIYGLAAATGAVLWSVPTPGSRYSMTAPIFQGDVAWAGAEPRVTRLRWIDGGQDWISSRLGDPWFPYMYSAPAIGAQSAYFGFFGWPGDDSGGFAVVDHATGVRTFREDGAFRSPICRGDTVWVVGGPDRNHQALSARDAAGAVRWTAATDLGGGTGSPALGHGILVVAGRDGNIEAFRASDGTHLWSRPVGMELYEMVTGLRATPGTLGTPAIADFVVYVGSLDGRLYALALDTGAVLWERDLGTPIASSPAVSGNMLFVGASDGHLYGFVVATRPAVDTSAPSAAPSAGSLRLDPPRPNPASGEVRLAWTQPRADRARLDVFDVAGRHVRRLVDRAAEAGPHDAVWDGADRRGARLPAGVYLVRLRVGASESTVRKVVLLRR